MNAGIHEHGIDEQANQNNGQETRYGNAMPLAAAKGETVIEEVIDHHAGDVSRDRRGYGFDLPQLDQRNENAVRRRGCDQAHHHESQELLFHAP